MMAFELNIWDGLSKEFLCKYFLLRKIAKLKNHITSFTPLESESLYEAWERFKELSQMPPSWHPQLFTSANIVQWAFSTIENLHRCSHWGCSHG